VAKAGEGLYPAAPGATAANPAGFFSVAIPAFFAFCSASIADFTASPLGFGRPAILDT